MANTQIEQIKDFINAERYREARIALKSLDHPKRDEWLNRLNTLARAKAAKVTGPQSHNTPPTTPKSTSQTSGLKVKIAQPARAMHREKALFKDATFTITSEHIVIQDAVYPLRQINSVSLFESAEADTIKKTALIGVVSLIVCMALAVVFYDDPALHFIALIAGAGCFILPLWLAWKLMPARPNHNYALRLGFHTVEEDAFVSPDKTYMTRIVHHINSALVQTGTHKTARSR